MKKRIKKILIDIAKKNEIFRSFLRMVLFFKNRLRSIRYYFSKIDNNLILFESYMGKNYSCSPKAIYEELLNNYSEYNFVWVFKNPEDYEFLKNERTIIIKYRSKEYYKFFSKAKYIVTNSRTPDEIIKKNNQVYVQCWHGTPLKRLGYDIIVNGQNSMNSKKDIEKKYSREIKKSDYFLSPSEFASEKFRTAFNMKKDIIVELGYPRNDDLVSYSNDKIENIKNSLSISSDKKIIFYAPTWRDNQHESGLGYTYETEIDFDLLKEQLGNQYIILYRPHYFVMSQFNYAKYDGFIVDISKVSDMNDLYLISDILITDYSSVMFDYALLKRKMIFYMYDIDSYENDLRGFYIDLSELPGSIVKTTAEIIKSVKDSTYDERYSEKYDKFNKKYNYLDDGKAAERVAKKIFGGGK